MKRLLALLTMFCALITAGQCMAYSLSLTPSAQTVGLGHNASVDVNLLLNPGEELFGFNFAMTFDPAVLRFDHLLFNTTQLQDYITGYDHPTGQTPDLVTFDGALAGPLGQTSDIVPLASLKFTGIATGTSLLNVNGSVLDFQGISEIPLSASASISPVPEPGTMMLIGSGLSGLAFLRRKFRMQC